MKAKKSKSWFQTHGPICLVCVGVLIVSLFLMVKIPPKNPWLLYLLLAAMLGSLMGGLQYSAGELGDLFSGFLMGCAGAALFMLPAGEEDPRLEILLAAVLTLVAGGFVVKDYLKRNHPALFARFPGAKRRVRAQRRERLLNKWEQKRLAALKEEIGLGERSLLLLSFTGGIYQCIRGSAGYFFIWIGGSAGVDKTRIIRDFSKEDQYLSRKRDFFLEFSRLSSVSLDKHCAPHEDLARVIKLRGPKLKKRYQVMEEITEEQLRRFFSGMEFHVREIQEETVKKILAGKKRAQNQIRFRHLDLLCTSLFVLQIAFSAVLLSPSASHQVCVAGVMLISALLFLLPVLFPDQVIFMDKDSQALVSQNRLNVFAPLGIGSVMLALVSLASFAYPSPWRFIFISLAVVAALLAAALLLKIPQRRKGNLCGMLLFSIILIPSLVAQFNYMLDYSQPDIQDSQILSMRVSVSSKGSPNYYVKVSTSSGQTVKLRVPERYYADLSVGKSVQIMEREGFFAIPYVYAMVPQQYLNERGPS